MPASKGKNLLYRLALPVLSPVAASDPVAGIKGAPVACRKNLLTIIRRNHVTGGAILLSCEDRDSFICTRAFHTDQIPDENTYFRVASITKMATALLAVRLMDLGLLDPDAPVSKLLPDGDKIKGMNGILFHHLLSHTSGMEDPPDLVRMLTQRKTTSLRLTTTNTTGGASWRQSTLL